LNRQSHVDRLRLVGRAHRMVEKQKGGGGKDKEKKREKGKKRGKKILPGCCFCITIRPAAPKGAWAMLDEKRREKRGKGEKRGKVSPLAI